MLNRLRTAIKRLRRSLFEKAEAAYDERDAAEDGSKAEAYAAGEAHAYGVAEGEVRKAEELNDKPD
jgi:hypothetical protein